MNYKHEIGRKKPEWKTALSESKKILPLVKLFYHDKTTLNAVSCQNRGDHGSTEMTFLLNMWVFSRYFGKKIGMISHYCPYGLEFSSSPPKLADIQGARDQFTCCCYKPQLQTYKNNFPLIITCIFKVFFHISCTVDFSPVIAVIFINIDIFLTKQKTCLKN